jgi:hypothetical protein
MESNQNAGRDRSARTRQHVLMPEADAIKAARRKLPDFEPYDTQKLLADARKASLEGRSLDEAVTATYNKHCRSQMAKLLHALGCDPADPNIWRTAFLRLARLHHNVGALVHRRRSGRSNDASQRFRDEWILLGGVTAFVEQGYSQREAVNFIADKEVFPHREIRPGLREAGRATQHARRAALWQKHQRLRRDARSTPDPLARALGLSASDYELWLARLDNPLPEPRPSGDNGAQRNKRVRKSPIG